MFGNIVNSLAIIVGSFFGIFLKRGIKEEYKSTIMDGIGLTVMIIGITSGITSENMILLIGSIVLGGIIGEVLRIEDRLDSFGMILQNKFGKGDTNISKGFITASLVYCVGAMAIVGAMEAGLSGDYQTLYVKSILDGISAIIFSSTLGIGVAFSAISVFLYQGTITILSTFMKGLLTPEVINEMSAVGGVLIVAIGLNILDIKKTRIGNLLPAIFIPIIYYFALNLFQAIS